MGTALQMRHETAIARIEETVSECSLATLQSHGAISQGFLMAAGIRQLQNLITDDMMADVMALQNTSLGFRTDKDRNADGSRGKGYPLPVVKQCFIEATLRGLRPVNNEWNIISSQAYVTKNGLMRLVLEWPGLTDLRLTPGVPVTKTGGALVPFRATWRINSVAQSIDRVETKDDDQRIPVRINARMGTDALIGKATRKMLATIYGILSGMHETTPEGEVEAVLLPAPPAPPSPSSLDQLVDTLQGGKEQDAQDGPGTEATQDSPPDDCRKQTAPDAAGGEGPGGRAAIWSTRIREATGESMVNAIAISVRGSNAITKAAQISLLKQCDEQLKLIAGAD